MRADSIITSLPGNILSNDLTLLKDKGSGTFFFGHSYCQLPYFERQRLSLFETPLLVWGM